MSTEEPTKEPKPEPSWQSVIGTPRQAKVLLWLLAFVVLAAFVIAFAQGYSST